MRNMSFRDIARDSGARMRAALTRKLPIVTDTSCSYISNQQFRSNPFASKFGRLGASRDCERSSP